nr:sigma 54-interacting transcriptional regulator [Thalassobacillus sp. C254]
MSEELSFDILHTVLDSAYEGIVIVDKQARIIHFNNAYSRITGIKKEQALGQPVTDIIDNTQLHMTLQTGQAERGKIQVISGQEMVVHRIPIWRGEEVVAAVGMLIFEGVSELHKILEMHQEKERKADKALADSQKKNKKQMVTLDQIIGKSKEMSETKRIARRAAKTLATVLITGESGTGKEMFAQSIHQLSPFADGPFVSVNCAAIPEHLLEAELFGYEEGAFTGARKGGKPGKFELADQGTLF